ncbi:MAG: putative O-glycosylation ligase, exosortase A system-associated [bacterium]|nr:putative O-glycosylation ligase, exosortase A system-associated [bacterium]
MRDLLVVMIVVGSLPACFRRPLVGLLMFSVLAYMRLQDLAWGFARYGRWSFYVAVVTFAGYVAHRYRKPPIMEVRTQLMVALATIVGLGLLFGEGEHELELGPYVEFVKIIGVAVFTTALIRTREHLRLMVWVIAMSFGFYAVKNGVAFVVRLGRLQIIRGPGGMLEDNNDFGLAMVLSVPILLYAGMAERRVVLRRGTLIMVPLAMMTVVATHSRGAFVAMGAMLMILVWRSKNRVMGLLIAGMLLLAGVAFAPSSYFERVATIRNFKEDGSAMGRLRAWAIARNMIHEHPMLGVGYNRFQVNYAAHAPEDTPHPGGPIVAHNSYLQMWAECGTPAFFIYMALLGLSLIDVWRVRKEARRRYHSSWILSYCAMFEAVFLTFMVGSMFLNRAQFDLIYHLEAMVLCFGRIARREMAVEDRHPFRGGGRFARGTLTLVRAPGFERRPIAAKGFRSGK